jgi:hypothetical protein
VASNRRGSGKPGGAPAGVTAYKVLARYYRHLPALRARQCAFNVTPFPVHNFLHSWSV